MRASKADKMKAHEQEALLQQVRGALVTGTIPVSSPLQKKVGVKHYAQ